MRDCIENCIENAIRQVFREERRVFYADKVLWFYVVVGEQVFFKFDAPYAKIVQKVHQRVTSLLEKHYALSGSGRFFIDKMMQPNFTVGKFYVRGEEYYLCESRDYLSESSGEVLPCAHYEKLCEAFHNVSPEEFLVSPERYHLPSDLSWKDFKEVYKKAFGEFPCVDIRDHSSNLIVCD